MIQHFFCVLAKGRRYKWKMSDSRQELLKSQAVSYSEKTKTDQDNFMRIMSLYKVSLLAGIFLHEQH